MPSDTDAALAAGEFILPTNRAIGAVHVAEDAQDKPCVYLCGNSLGALPKRAQTLIQEELQVWGSSAVKGHFEHPHNRPWMKMTDPVNDMMAKLVGAKTSEVSCQSTLTSNLHLLMNTFYKPTATRFKILCEARAFPSDQYAFASQAALHGLDPSKALLELSPRKGEFSLREEDILAAIEREGDSIAIVLFSGVQYYTGQWFPMQTITRTAKAKGCICAWDLAHAIGNVPLKLHEWDVDFAVWCTYKYLNSGPGGIGGLFVHEKWTSIEKPKFAGWWGHDPETRFEMPPKFVPIIGAQGFQQSNPSTLAVASLQGSLQIFDAIGIDAVRERSIKLTAFLETLLVQSPYYLAVETLADEKEITKPAFTIITPRDPGARGAQLSLLFFPLESGVMQKVFAELEKRGVLGDERNPDVIRLTPVTLYNTAEDCTYAAQALNLAFQTL